MKLPPIVLVLIGLFSLALGLVSSNQSAAEVLVHNLNISAKASGNAASPPSNGIQIAALWDPNRFISEEDMAGFQAKGSWLTCLLDATDENAGKAWPDPYNRVPKSARSQWTGSLACKLTSPTLQTL
jgi:hypothetical protein